MSSTSSTTERRRRVRAVRDALRELNTQLAAVNQHVGARLELRPVDLQCLDLIAREGPLSPKTVSVRSGLHAATLTGVLDRLERGGWVARERDPADRRGVRLRALTGRAAEIYGAYSGMNAALEALCADYSDAELEVLADFLRRATAAGVGAVEDFRGPDRAQPANPTHAIETDRREAASGQ